MQQRIVVTAGASGIGLGIVDAFLDSGALVHVCDVSPDALVAISGRHPRLSASLADVGDVVAVSNLEQRAIEAMGGVDVLVNNAGIGGPRAPVDQIADEDWASVFRVNVTGAFNTVRAFAPHFKAQRSGCIINISTTSVRTGLPDRLPYVASKAALEGMTFNLARELGPFNIRCNSLLPGSIENERGRQLMRDKAAREGVTYEEALGERLKFISMRSRIEVSEIGETAVFLASHAARHITGQRLSVCGNAEWEA
jgi:NAD(P)-dependent dehydrogenase (short-subunit alcohol dehydrogenase family)